MTASSRAALKIAVAQPRSTLGDVIDNVERHAAAIREIAARVVVFPELSLTGYNMDAHPIDPADSRLGPLVDAAGASSAIALVGAPTSGPSGRHISMLCIDGTGVSIAYSKMFLGGEEPEHYVAGPEPAVLEVDGWRLGLAICKDNGTPEHASVTAEFGVDAYVSGVCETEDDASVQPERAARVIDDHGVWVAYASFAGPTGGGFDETAGRSAVVRPDGMLSLQLGRQPGQVGATMLYDM